MKQMNQYNNQENMNQYNEVENMMKMYKQEIEDLREDLREEGLPDNGSTFDLRAEEIYKFYFGSGDGEESEEVIPCDFSRYEGSEISYEVPEEEEVEVQLISYWFSDHDTGKDYFEGTHLHAYYDDPGDDTLGHVEVTLPRKITESLVQDIKENPDDYFIRVYDFKNGRGELPILYHQLEEMPFDKNGIHATGSEYLENGEWVTEYEDDECYDFIVKEVKFC